MRKFIIIILSITTSLFLLTGCFEEDQMGYPKTMQIPVEGGTYKITGSEPIYFFVIGDGTEEHSSLAAEDSIGIEHKWLKVERIGWVPEIILNVEPNSTGKKREMWIYGYDGPRYATIKVIQLK